MNKLSFFIALLLLIGSRLFAQVGINFGNSNPHPSAGLDVKFNNKGLLPPRMSKVELNAIADPADGLLVYCTDCGSNGLGSLSMYMSGAWYSFSANCMNPISPSEGIHVSGPTQIEWNWNTVSGATGYKWNTINDYATSVEMDAATTKTETGLTCNTTYTRYAWAYNTCGNSTAVALNQTTSACGAAGCAGTPTVSYGGQTYNTVQIGTQCWFKENLNIGTRINGIQEQTDNSTIEKYCYDDLDSNCNIYGGLYQWNEMMQYVTTSGVQGICPTGWHIPTDAEWTTVTTFLGGESDAGGKMKTTGTIEDGNGLWISPNTAATNESGFSSVPAGNRDTDGTFYGIGDSGFLWSSTESNTGYAWYRYVSSYEGGVNSFHSSKSYGFSVRCLRDF